MEECLAVWGVGSSLKAVMKMNKEQFDNLPSDFKTKYEDGAHVARAGWFGAFGAER